MNGPRSKFQLISSFSNLWKLIQQLEYYPCINLLTVQSYFWPGLTASARVLSASDNMFCSITIAPLPVLFRFRSFLFVAFVILAISFYNKKNLMKFIEHLTLLQYIADTRSQNKGFNVRTVIAGNVSTIDSRNPVTTF